MDYINQIVNKMDYNTNSYSAENVCAAAAIYGLDGSAWAWSPTFPELTTYEFPLEGMDGSVKNVTVDEIQAAIKAAEGVRNPTEAGIRLGNEKFMFVTHDDVTGVAQLSKRGGGGAAICKTVSAVIIALWTKDAPTSTGGVQTAGQTAEQVGAMASYLKEQGY